MSWSRRLVTLAGLAALGVSACGFRPAYGPDGAAGALKDRILFDAPETGLGFLFVEHLEDRLGRAAVPDYRLSYAIDTARDRVASTSDTTRYHILGRVDYNLKAKSGGAVLLSGHVRNFTAYVTSSSTVATLSAQRDAQARLMVVLADDLVTRLIAESGSLPQ